MWCARIGFEFPFEVKIAETGVLSRFFLRNKDSRIYLTIQSGRGTTATVIVPEEDRPKDIYRDWTMTKGVYEGVGEVEIRRVCVSAAPTFIEEIREIVGFTVIYVSFLLEGEPPPALDDATQAFLTDWGLTHVRQFIEAYRLVCNQVDVFIPSKEDSSVIRVEIAEKFSETGDELIGEFRGVSRIFNVPAHASNPPNKAPLPESLRLELARRLRAGEQLHVSDSLQLEAMELSRIHGDHRLAMVTMGTGFETYIQWRIAEEFRARGITHYPPDQTESLDNQIPTKNVKPLLDKYAKYLAGAPVDTSSEYNTWNLKAYTPRNDIVHRGRMDITEADVIVAVNAINDFRVYLDNKLTAARPPPSALRRRLLGQ